VKRAAVKIGLGLLAAGMLHAAVATEDANARARIQAPDGVSAPSISPQATQLLQSPTPIAQREIALLIERAQRSTLPAPARRPSSTAPKLDLGPSGSASDAAWLLGLIYAHGAGTPQDLSAAQLWFERAAAGGNRLAVAGLAWCALEGCQGAVNVPLARTRINTLKSTHSARALYLDWLAQSKLLPLNTAALPSPNKAPDADRNSALLPGRELLVQAARMGDVHATLELGLEAVSAQRTDVARSYFQRAATDGSLAGANNLRLLDSQLALARASGESWANMDAPTLFAAAQRSHRGEGQVANYTEAIRLYRMAEAKGSASAREMLTLIFSRTSANGQVDIAWIQRLAQLNIGKSTEPYGARSVQLFQRERTPLLDYLPALWKARINLVS
jgi:uncharacterized protein